MGATRDSIVLTALMPPGGYGVEMKRWSPHGPVVDDDCRVYVSMACIEWAYICFSFHKLVYLGRVATVLNQLHRVSNCLIVPRPKRCQTSKLIRVSTLQSTLHPV
uniref:Uncharacterized protein n=1 Tax=Peronospora matthiolae TaxID=2874970 RepID=A0AAV1T2N9_9STRA